jgi:hypothetical protein
MGFREITDLRKAGKLNEALSLALAEHAQAPQDTYITGALAWVYYAMLKPMDATQFHDFNNKFRELLQLGIDISSVKFLLPSLQWVINNMGWNLMKANREMRQELRQLLRLATNIPAIKSPENSVVVKMFVNAFKKDKSAYFGLVDWQGFDNFLVTQEQNDYLSEEYNGCESMGLVESYVGTYCKRLLPEEYNGQFLFERERVEAFMPYLGKLIEAHPEYKWFPYYKAQLHNALGDRKAALQTIIPFVRLHRNDFLAWRQLGDFLESNDEKLSCYCRGIQCKSKAEMLIGLRRKLIPFFLGLSEYGAAKYELDQIVQIRNQNNWKITQQLVDWQGSDWYVSNEKNADNKAVYTKYSSSAEELLYGDIEPVDVFITWKDEKKLLAGYTVGSASSRTGVFRGNLINGLMVHNTYSVKLITNQKNEFDPISAPILCDSNSLRQQFIHRKDIIILWVDSNKHLAGFIIEGSNSSSSGILRGNYADMVSPYLTYSIELIKNSRGDFDPVSEPVLSDNASFRSKFSREVVGTIRINEGNSFGFVGDVFISPKTVEKNNFKDGDQFSGMAIKAWNKNKSAWSWQVYDE